MENIEIRMDVSGAEEGIQVIAVDLKELQKLAKGIGAGMANAFAPMINSLQKIEVNVCAMTDAVNATSDAISQLMVQMNEGDGAEQWANGLSITVDGLTLFAELATVALTVMGHLGRAAIVSEGAIAAMGTTISSIIGAITALGVTVSTGGVLAIIAAVAAAIAAIVLLIANWDTCQATLTQGFSNFSESAGGSWWSLYNIIQPIIDYFNEAIDNLWEKHLKPFWENLCAACKSIGEGITTIWNDVLLPVINWIINIFAPAIVSIVDVIVGAVSVVVGFIVDVVGGIIEIIGGLIKFIAGVFTGDWKKAWEGIVEILKGVFDGIVGIFKGVFNKVILVINIIIAKIYSVIAGVLNGIGGVAQFIGNIFGQDWSFRVPSNPPQIPYLAKGAVLPANRPFLAVVGDQRHGTNVEAPLATIQEAVALVLEDHIGAMMAGFEALLKEQQATRRTIEGIGIGDAVIGRAAERYGRKMAVVRGGF